MRVLKKVHIKGQSDAEWIFRVYTLDHSFSDIGAIYAFIKANLEHDNKVKVIYVGQTADLRNRLSSHEKLPCINKHGANYIAILEEENEHQRENIEADILQNKLPKCNTQTPT